MEDMTDFRRQLSSRRPSDWEHLPDFPLYMDQVLSYMERQTVRLDEDDALTASMVNNYAKNALLPRAEGKKYNRVMSVRDMDLLIRAELKDDRSVEDGYGAFLDSLDSALTAAAQEMEPYESGADPADAAVHFGLLSYAAGLVSRHYVAQLRSQAPTVDKAAKAGKERKDHA